MVSRLGMDVFTFIVVRADAVLGLALSELVMVTLENIDTEALALGSYYRQDACIFQSVHPPQLIILSCRANLQSFRLYGLSYSVLILSPNFDYRSHPCRHC
jgi:hypothetical protein